LHAILSFPEQGAIHDTRSFLNLNCGRIGQIINLAIPSFYAVRGVKSIPIGKILMNGFWESRFRLLKFGIEGTSIDSNSTAAGGKSLSQPWAHLAIRRRIAHLGEPSTAL
jgi:hypothetical protein